MVAVGKGAQEKHQFHGGMFLSGQSVQVSDPRLEVAASYKTSKIKVTRNPELEVDPVPAFIGIPPDLETYRGRGHRRLDARAYEAKCPAEKE
jgi:glycerol kinase